MTDFHVWFLVLFMGASLILYFVLGGADFGAGIIELFTGRHRSEKHKKIVNAAMGPVWEANHMWLIIIVVILFMGFPKAFQIMMTSLHFPLLALLVGIVARGAAFSFRHYDAVKEVKTQKLYTFVFGASSLWSAFWIGVIGCSLFRGKINSQSEGFFNAYIQPWWGLYPAVTGVFVVSLFSFLACVYLVGESHDVEFRRFFMKLSRKLNTIVVICGGLVFLSAFVEGSSLVRDFIRNPVSLVALVGASVFFLYLRKVLKSYQEGMRLRILGAGQVALILIGWLSIYWPNLLVTTQEKVSFIESAAPAPVLFQLNLALGVGSLLIFPFLFYLFYVFKGNRGLS